MDFPCRQLSQIEFIAFFQGGKPVLSDGVKGKETAMSKIEKAAMSDEC
jgi:hypothetical protein